MNREIKFRGKDALTGKWVFGDLAHNKKVTGDGRLEGRTMVGGYEVDPDTVGQFTGLCDKNGIEIYESDIVKTKEYGIDIANGVYCSNVVGYDTFIITWNNGGFILENNKRCFRLCKDSHLEVIGNIYDNPELLKGGRK